MKSRDKFSKDPKVTLVSIKEFFENSNYLLDAKDHLFKDKIRPIKPGFYYKFTSDKLILLSYSCKRINFGMDFSEKLDSILVAIRDGVTEYELLNDLLAKLQDYKSNHKQHNRTDESINKLTEIINLLPKYDSSKTFEFKKFEECLIETNYRTNLNELKNKYVVFDVETNGTRKASDDLLSLSIYDPTSGICYNRLFPLDLQPLVLTSGIHGITDEQLSNIPHMSQEEVDNLIDFFHLKDRILLSYSGGKGTFDSGFLINYCKRHNLCGFEYLHYENIKSLLPTLGYGYEGQLTKDNLCNLFGIDGVQELHSSQNDCVLEWKLFEQIKDENLFFIKNELYRYNEGYIIPVSYLTTNPDLAKIAKINIPHIVASCKEIYRYNLSQDIVLLNNDFPIDITLRRVLKNGIISELNAIKLDNIMFLAQNKRQLTYVGTLFNDLKETPIITQKEDTPKPINRNKVGLVAEVNGITNSITENLKDVFNYIKTVIFKDEEITSQELCISNDNKVLALCDLSSPTKVLEIKTKPIRFKENKIIDDLLVIRQLYYESKGRDIYLLSIEPQEHRENFEIILDSVSIIIYNVSLIVTENKLE